MRCPFPCLSSIPRFNRTFMELKYFDFNPDDWGVDVSMEEPEQEEKTQVKKEISTRLIVECGDVTKLSILFSELQDRGFKCELKE